MIDFSLFARLYARGRVGTLRRQDAEELQKATLLRLVGRAAATRFGLAHDFHRIDDVAAFGRQVPIRDYSAFWEDWWQPAYPTLVNCTWPGRIPFFSMTSGTTTGRSKYIPYTHAMRRAAVRGFLDLLCWHFVNRPQSRLLGGRALGLTGPVHLDRTGSGAVSAITLAAVPHLLQHRILPPSELANLKDWKEKIHRLAPLALRSDVRMLGGSPNWLLIFLDEVARAAGGGETLADWFPELELVVHGGLNFAPYERTFRKLMSEGHSETREMYSASEGVFAIADAGPGDGMRLHLDGNVFFEFVPVDEISHTTPRRFWIGTAETGVDYALVITTAAGLWSYVLGDVVRLVDLAPPRLLVRGRVGQGLSAFGEHLIESEIAGAIASAADRTGANVVDYCVFARHLAAGGHHVYFVETRPVLPETLRHRFTDILNRTLAENNEDYADLREGDLSIGPPEVHFVPEGAFSRWMEGRRGLGGQNKVPRIVVDPALAEDLAARLTSRETEAGA